MSDDITDLVRELQARAVEIKRSRGHMKVEHEGHVVATLPVSPSDHRGLTNARLQLERAGVLPKERQQTGAKRGKRPEVLVTPYDGPLYPQGRKPRPKR